MMPPPTAQSTYGQPPPFNPPLTRSLSASTQPPFLPKKKNHQLSYSLTFTATCCRFSSASLACISLLLWFCFFFFCVLSAQFSDIFQTRKDSETNGRRAERGVGVGKKWKKSCYDFAINFCQGRLLLCHSPQRRAPKKLCVLPPPIPPSFCIPPPLPHPLPCRCNVPSRPRKKK